jgi:hypothetical protein
MVFRSCSAGKPVILLTLLFEAVFGKGGTPIMPQKQVSWLKILLIPNNSIFVARRAARRRSDGGHSSWESMTRRTAGAGLRIIFKHAVEPVV